MAAATQTDLADPSLMAKWAIEPRGVFSRHYELFRAGAHVTTLQMALWREGGTFTIAGHDFAVSRPSLWTDTFHLLVDGESVCDVRRKFWSSKFELATAEQRWVLQPATFFSTTYQILAHGREQGRISRAGWFTRRRVAKFASVVPPPVQVLAIFLVLIVANRQSKAH